MDQEERKAILTRAFNTYDQAAWEDMAIEKMAGLTNAIYKARRTKPGTDVRMDAMCNVIDAVADVTFMMKQLQTILRVGTDLQKDHEVLRLTRLRNILDRHDPLNL